MTNENQPKKKLNLNKETLLRLQERQLQSLLGANEELLSGPDNPPPGHSLAICCGVSINGNCSDGQGGGGDGGGGQNLAENTCCKKSC